MGDWKSDVLTVFDSNFPAEASCISPMLLWSPGSIPLFWLFDDSSYNGNDQGRKWELFYTGYHTSKITSSIRWSITRSHGISINVQIKSPTGWIARLLCACAGADAGSYSVSYFRITHAATLFPYCVLLQTNAQQCFNSVFVYGFSREILHRTKVQSTILARLVYQRLVTVPCLQNSIRGKHQSNNLIRRVSFTGLF
jgi:hypothetical protein